MSPTPFSRDQKRTYHWYVWVDFDGRWEWKKTCWGDYLSIDEAEPGIRSEVAQAFFSRKDRMLIAETTTYTEQVSP